MFFWSMSGSFTYRHHIEPRVNFSSLFHQNHIDVSRTACADLGDKLTSGCEDHKCAHMCRRVGGMMTDVHVAILSKSLHICEKKKCVCTGCESHVGADLGAACASLHCA